MRIVVQRLRLSTIEKIKKPHRFTMRLFYFPTGVIAEENPAGPVVASVDFQERWADCQIRSRR
jgi:hypothetical protein